MIATEPKIFELEVDLTPTGWERIDFAAYGIESEFIFTRKETHNPFSDESLKQRWIEALRSGKYPQGRGWMKQRSYDGTGYAYDPIGVLCDIVDPNGWKEVDGRYTWNDKWWVSRVEGMSDISFRYTFSKSGSFVPGYSIRNEELAPALSHMSDEGVSFSTISEFIELL